SSETFWTTMGMFPQELDVGFPKSVKLSRVTIECCVVRSLQIERSLSEAPVDFEQCAEKGKSVQHSEGQLQTEELPLPGCQATYLCLIIKPAFDHFVSGHQVMAEGTAESA
ncbi:IFT25 protein, partial [Rhinopomastus cyanomelas]|nr:IFT25 protein [Rhinopomastus cyanomelas]